MGPHLRRAVIGRLSHAAALDGPAGALQRGIRAAVPEGTALKDFLSGTWLGHPLHPPLTDVVVGSWTSALLLDLVGGRDAAAASDLLVATGVAAAVPTAAAGLSDWAELRGGTRRVGAVHALGNTTALTLHALSLAARRRGDRGRGVALSTTGYAVATVSAWLGGHLSFGAGVGVDQTVFEEGPEDWRAVGDDAQLAEGTLAGARADGVAVLLVRRDGRVHALVDRCSHRGCSLHEGRLNEDGTITCPCHGSTFALDGSIVQGPATAPQPAFETRVVEGRIEVRRPSGG